MYAGKTLFAQLMEFVPWTSFARRESLRRQLWPAIAVTVLAPWLVTSVHKGKRNTGFWIFIVSKALWIEWGLGAQAYALVTLPVCLDMTNIRGERKSET